MNHKEITEKAEAVKGLGGMTVNERLVLSSLMELFDRTKINDRGTAQYILTALKVDQKSIEQILK